MSDAVVHERRFIPQKGVTLIELLVVMVVLAVVSTALVTIWISVQGSYGYTVVSSRQREAARDAMALLARELRDVQAPSLGSAVPAIPSAGGYGITFFTTFHTADAKNPTALSKRVEYLIKPDPDKPDSHALFRKVGDDEQMIVRGVRNMKEGAPLFSYFTQAGSPMPMTPALSSDFSDNILTIRIQLLVDENPGHAPSVMTLTTTVQPRNLRST